MANAIGAKLQFCLVQRIISGPLAPDILSVPSSLPRLLELYQNRECLVFVEWKDQARRLHAPIGEINLLPSCIAALDGST
jgi:hypothetical protein